MSKRKISSPRKVEVGFAIDELLDMMESRGLTIEDRSLAVSILENVGYYRLNQYAEHLMRGNQYLKGAHFDEIYQLYLFDSKLRIIVFELLSEIEISFRAHLVQYHAYHYGSLGYRNPANFINEKEHRNFLYEIDRYVKRHRELVVTGIEAKQKDYPIWIVCDIFTFGDLIKLYTNLFKKDRTAIAKIYNIPEMYMETWLHHLAVIRNSCAHHGKLYGKPAISRPLLSSRLRKLDTQEGSLFISFFIMKEFCLDKQVWQRFYDKFNGLLNRYKDCVKLHVIGFPTDWQHYLRGHADNSLIE